MGLEERTAVVIVDMQEPFLELVPQRQQLIENVQRVLEHCISHDLYTLVFEYDLVASRLADMKYHKHWSTPPGLLASFPQVQEYVQQQRQIPRQVIKKMKKERVHAPTIPELQDLLRYVPRHSVERKRGDDGMTARIARRLQANNSDQLYFAGVTRAICVPATARTAAAYGFAILTAEDTMANAVHILEEQEIRRRDKEATKFFTEKGHLRQKHHEVFDYLHAA